MTFTLDTVVPWGRSFAEYCEMFGLSEDDLPLRILGCGDGPASFNVEATRRGHKVVSCDPLYQFSRAEIESRIRATYDNIVRQLHENREAYDWQKIGSPEQLGEVRMSAMRQFLGDCERGRAEGRYLVASLPELSFGDKEFDLALVSHLLFTYSEHLSLDVHLFAVVELCRVAREVRIFPLLDISGKELAHIEPVVSELKNGGVQSGVCQNSVSVPEGR